MKEKSSLLRKTRGKGRKGKEEKDNDPTNGFKNRFRLNIATSQSRRSDQEQERRVASSSRLPCPRLLPSPIVPHQYVNVPNAFANTTHANFGALAGINNDPPINWSLNSNHLDGPPSERGRPVPTDFHDYCVGTDTLPHPTHGAQRSVPAITGDSARRTSLDPAILPQRTHLHSPNINPSSSFYNAHGQHVRFEAPIHYQPNLAFTPTMHNIQEQTSQFNPDARPPNITLPTPTHSREQMLPNFPPYAQGNNLASATNPFNTQEGNHSGLSPYTSTPNPAWSSLPPPPILGYGNIGSSNVIPHGYHLPTRPPIAPPFSGNYGGVPNNPTPMLGYIPSSSDPVFPSHGTMDHLIPGLPVRSDLTTSQASEITPRPPTGRSFHHPPTVGWTPNPFEIREHWRTVRCQCGAELRIPVHILGPAYAKCHHCGRFDNWP